jgi:beta-galactosidase
VDPVQPGLGLDKLFGVQERYVEFAPDLLEDLIFTLDGQPTRGSFFLQVYEPTAGKPVGWYGDGRVAVVDNILGEGCTRLVGTMCGAGYATYPDCQFPAFFAAVLAYGGVQQHVRSSDGRIKARAHDGVGGTYLWVANPTHHAIPVRLELSERWGPYTSGHALWGEDGDVQGRSVRLTVAGRDVTVLRLSA